MAPRRDKVVTVQRRMAVIDRPQAATAATCALAQAGFPEAVTVLHDDRTAVPYEPSGRHVTLIR